MQCNGSGIRQGFSNLLPSDPRYRISSQDSPSRRGSNTTYRYKEKLYYGNYQALFQEGEAPSYFFGRVSGIYRGGLEGDPAVTPLRGESITDEEGKAIWAEKGIKLDTGFPSERPARVSRADGGERARKNSKKRRMIFIPGGAWRELRESNRSSLGIGRGSILTRKKIEAESRQSQLLHLGRKPGRG